MNELSITINFSKQKFLIDGIDLISGDYNSTIIHFNFEDKKSGTKTIEIRPLDSDDKNPTFMSTIENDQVVLVAKDSENHNVSPFQTGGTYIMEVSTYDEDSKLTTIAKHFNVLEEQIILSDDIVTPYLPIFDELMQDIISATNKANNVNIDISKENDITTITITNSDGVIKTAIVKDGVGIEKIEKVSTSGLTDSYCITMTNGDTYNYDVVNGRGIVSITKTNTTDNIDTYTILYNDGTTSTFTVNNGILTISQMLEELTFITNILPKVSGSGKDVILTNTGDSKLLTLSIDGKSQQNGTPSPNSRVAIQSLGLYNNDTNKYDISIKTTGKNIFDKNTTALYSSNLTYQTNSTGIDLKTSTLTYGFILFDLGKISDFENKTLSLSLTSDYISKLSSTAFVACNDTGGNRSQIGGSLNSSGKLTATIGSGYTQTRLTLRLYINSVSTNSTYPIYNIQVEEHNQPTDYENYQSSSKTYSLSNPIYSINEIKDKLMVENGYLNVYRNIAKLTLNGTEEWTVNSENDTIGYYETNITNKKYGINNLISDYFQTTEATDISSIKGESDSNAIIIGLAKSIVSYDVNAFKTWLSSHNTEIQYELATSSIDNVGEVSLPNTFKKQTNITMISNIDSSIEVSALKDISNL